MVDSQACPLVVCDADGAPIDVVLESEKGFRKSIESGTLWSLHPDTGRLLPYTGGAQVTMEDRGHWYRAVLGGAGQSPPTAGASQIDKHIAGDKSAAEVTKSTNAGSIGSVFLSLVAIIRDRRREMPEGSYTTYLFESGKEKIRKKTGEEAIELILAGNRADLTRETADLIYHLLVLLEVEGISLDEIAVELRRR